MWSILETILWPTRLPFNLQIVLNKIWNILSTLSILWHRYVSSCYRSGKVPSHSMATANLKKSEEFMTNTTAASKYIPRRPRISINWNPTFQSFFEVNFLKLKFSKIFGSLRNFFCFTIHKKLNKSCSLKKYFLALKKNSFETLWSEVWKVGFQFMLILGLLGMYFDAAVVFVTKS